MSSLLDAIGTAGTALDRFTGGRAVRGLLAGRPRELMSVVPFSETMGLTSPDEVTSGRDLLNQFGLTDPQSKGWGPMLGGMAVEMATSPLSYLGGFGAAKAAPKLASEATSLAEQVAPTAGKLLADEPGALTWGGAGLFGKAKALPPPAHTLEAAVEAVQAAPAAAVDPAVLAKAKSIATVPEQTPFVPLPGTPAAAKAATSDEAIAADLFGSGGPGIAGQAQKLAMEQALSSPLDQLRPPTVEKKVAEYISELGMQPGEVSSPLLKSLQSQAQREVDWLSQGSLPSKDPFKAGSFSPELLTKAAATGETRKPLAILDAMNEEVVQKLMGQWGGKSLERAQPHDVALAHAFVNPVKLPRDQAKANALLESIARQLEGGLNAVAEYSGPRYHDINKYLRTAVGQDPSRLEAVLEDLRAAGRTASETMSPELLNQLAQEEAQYAAKWGFDPIRLAQFEGTRGLSGQMLNLMDQFRTPQPMQLYRGVDQATAELFSNLIGAPITSPEAIGREVFDPGFLSTSLDQTIARRFARGPEGVLFDLGQVSKGRPAAFINPEEKEVLFPPGRRLQIEGLVSPANPLNAAVVKAKLLQALIAAMGAGGGYAALQDQSAPTLPASPAA